IFRSTTTVEFEGITIPVPAQPELWLAANYGESWRVPDPAFEFRTPERMWRRYLDWFGHYNWQRTFWKRYYEWRTEARSDHSFAASILADHGNSGTVHDLGCGEGRDARYLASHGRRVMAVD